MAIGLAVLLAIPLAARLAWAKSLDPTLQGELLQRGPALDHEDHRLLAACRDPQKTVIPGAEDGKTITRAADRPTVR